MVNKTSTREAYGRALVEIGKDENIVVLDADLSCCTMSMYFNEQYPVRFFNVGIAECNMVGIGAGLALCGKKVFVNSFAMFSAGRAFEQIRNSIAYPNLNVAIIGTHAGITVGKDGATHQCLEDISLMRTIPNMTVLCPADAAETKKAVEWLKHYKGPAYLRLSRLEVENICDSSSVEIGRATTMRDGNDATIIACGLMVHKALEAAEELAKQNIDVRVLNMNTIKPIDRDSIIKAAQETKGIVTAEDHNIIGGLGSAVAEVIAETHPVKMARVGVRDCFGRSGDPADLMEKYGLTSKQIADAVKNYFKVRLRAKAPQNIVVLSEPFFLP